MTTPSPEPASVQLLEELFHAALSTPHDEMRIRRIERDAQRLEPVQKFVVLGAVAATRRDYESLKSNYDRAAALSGRSLSVLFNYAISLGLVGRYSEARDIAFEAVDRNPGHVELFRRTFNYLLEIGAYTSAAKLLPQADKYKIELDNAFVVAGAAAFLEEHGRSEDEVLQVAELARRTASGHGYVFAPSTSFMSYSSGRPSLVFQLTLNTEAGEAIDIEAELFELLAKEPLDIEDSGELTIMFGVGGSQMPRRVMAGGHA